MHKVLVLFVVLAYVTATRSQCINDKYYKYYHDLIQNEKGNIQKVFDGILEKYGNIDKVLEDLLRKLNETDAKAESELNGLQNFNKDVIRINNDSDTNLESLLKNLNAIEEGLKLVNISENVPEELRDAENTSNKTVLIPTASEIPTQEKELEKWNDLLKELSGKNYSNDIMNIPHSVSDEINLLEKLMTEGSDASCFYKLHNDLKLLFIELANLFDLSIFLDDLNKIKEKASKNKNGADDIVSNTNRFIEKENEYKDIHRLANETLQLAEEIEELKESVNKLSGHNEEIISDRLKKLKEMHEAELRKLDEKYNVKEGKLLLNDLNTTKQQIENINMEDIKKDIDNYIRDINYYTCVLEKCEKAGETISDCKREE